MAANPRLKDEGKALDPTPDCARRAAELTGRNAAGRPPNQGGQAGAAGPSSPGVR